MTPPGAGDAARQEVRVIAFWLGGERFALALDQVEEVLTPRRVHPLPDPHPPLAGIVPLRGEMLPVLDVAPLLGLPPRPHADGDVIAVGWGAARVGVIVDGVPDALSIPAGALRPPLAAGAAPPAWLLGVARIGDELVTLLDVQALLSSPQPLLPDAFP
ncbi:MAG: chemotaxis protein CheW [Gemmatimonadota bacterium]|nr:chemotaxis protein CheW [Gemmatimonadota bacterium]